MRYNIEECGWILEFVVDKMQHFFSMRYNIEECGWILEFVVEKLQHFF